MGLRSPSAEALKKPLVLGICEGYRPGFAGSRSSRPILCASPEVRENAEPGAGLSSAAFPLPPRGPSSLPPALLLIGLFVEELRPAFFTSPAEVREDEKPGAGPSRQHISPAARTPPAPGAVLPLSLIDVSRGDGLRPTFLTSPARGPQRECKTGGGQFVSRQCASPAATPLANPPPGAVNALLVRTLAAPKTCVPRCSLHRPEATRRCKTGGGC